MACPLYYYRSHSELSGAPMYRKLKWLVHCILSFTLLTPSDTPTYRKLEWLVYHILLLTLHAPSKTPAYNLTTDQYGTC